MVAKTPVFDRFSYNHVKVCQVKELTEVILQASYPTRIVVSICDEKSDCLAKD